MKEVRRLEVRNLMDNGAQVVEILPPEEFQEDHLPGAINLPLRELETDSTRRLNQNRAVIVYCWDSA
jgi:rhodanese-related sulfurtransferase